MLVFLDFDGVLRRRQSPLYRLEACCIESFEAAMRQLPGAEIVITSSWREAFGLRKIKAPFSSDIADRIIGVTPQAQSREGYYRHREVLAFIKRKGLEGRPWVALEDDPEHFPPSTNTLLIDPEVGFDHQAAGRLVQLLGGG